jgi:hypothetical protein
MPAHQRVVLPTPFVPTLPTPTPAAGPVPTVVDATEAIDRHGARTWIVTLRNDGPTPITRPGAVVRLRDAAGALIGERRTWAHRTTLEPGESTGALLNWTGAPEHDRSELLGDRGPGMAAPQRLLTARLTSAATADPLTVELCNPHPEPAHHLHLLALAHDNNGAPAAWADRYPTPDPLPPAACHTFSLPTTAYRAAEPARWTLWALASPAP